MTGVDVYPMLLAGLALGPALWVFSRGGASPSRRVEIVFFICVAAVWTSATLGLLGVGQAPIRSGEDPVDGAAQDGGRSLRAPPWTPRLFRPPATGAQGPASNLQPDLDESTAIYDISAHTVYLPDGTRLEAHSGLGSRLDDPNHVDERMRGATPPHLYDLALRERPFHGVQALRLKPVGGGTTYGRVGLLAHTYMLGPNGDSNGCVVFKNYDAFLQAFQNGGVRRLLVVDRIRGNEYALRSLATQ